MVFMYLKALFWNVQGIGNDPTIARIKQLVRLYKISLIAVFEPMLAPEKVEFITHKLKFCFSFSNTSSSIWLFAKPGFH